MYLAESDIVVLLLHDLLHGLLLFEGDEAETSSLVGLVLHGQLHRLHLFRHLLLLTLQPEARGLPARLDSSRIVVSKCGSFLQTLAKAPLFGTVH